MSKSNSNKPRITIDTTPSGSAGGHGRRAGRPHERPGRSHGHTDTQGNVDPERMGSDFRSAVANYTGNFRSMLDGLFPGHGNAAFFAIIGFLVALVFISIGLRNTIIVILLVVAGIAFGQQLDGNPKIIRAIKRHFNSNRRR